MNQMNQINCSICNRLTPINYIEKHHLKPKCKKGKETILVCNSCGDMIHKLFTISELNKNLNTLDAIKSNERIQKWIKWINKKPNDFKICMKNKKRK